mgnify:CR=1 FL=1
MNKLLISSTLLFSLSAYGKNVSTPSKAVIIGTGSQPTKRVCYYQDKAYSIGAILQVGKHYIICKQENKFESNGPLSWYSLEATTQKEAVQNK